MINSGILYNLISKLQAMLCRRSLSFSSLSKSLSEISLTSLFALLRKFFEQKKPEKFFLFFSIFFGLILIFLTPPLLSADEPAHFSRAYSLSEGKIKSVVINNQAGNFEPLAFQIFEKIWYPMFYNTSAKTDFSQIKESKKIKIDKNKLYFANQCYQTLYSPVAYLPQTAGIFIAKYFTDSVYKILITAKIFLLFFYTLLGYYAIKSTPVYKWLFMLILLAPTALSMGCSVSADGVLIPASILYIAKILEYSFRKDKTISLKEVYFLAFLAITLALIKQSFLTTLLIFFIPKDKFKDKYPLKLAAILLPALLCTVVWSTISSGWFVPLNNSNPVLQVKFILTHPFTYILTVLKTIKLCTIMWIYGIIGILGWNNLFLFPVIYLLYFAALCINTVYKEIFYSVTLRQKLVLACVFFINFIFICTELYISWTPPHFTNFINIVQGRYLIPIIAPLFTAIGFIFVSVQKRPVKIDYFNFIVVIITYLNLFFSMFIVYYF